MAKALATEKQVKLLIEYHKQLVESCGAYLRPTEMVMEEMTVLALEKLIAVKGCDIEN